MIDTWMKQADLVKVHLMAPQMSRPSTMFKSRITGFDTRGVCFANTFFYPWHMIRSIELYKETPDDNA